MDDNTLLDAVRDDFAGVAMTAGADEILAGGSALRHRRLRNRVYGTAGAALCAIGAIGGVALASGGSAAPAHAELTAWTVQKQANGTIDVTIRDLTHLAGLAARLDADGVPAEVTSNPHYPAACVDYPAMTADMAAVITLGPQAGRLGYAFVIRPSAIPGGSKLLLDVVRLTPHRSARGNVTTIGAPVDRLWGFGAGDAKGDAVQASLGLAYDTGNC